MKRMFFLFTLRALSRSSFNYLRKVRNFSLKHSYLVLDVYVFVVFKCVKFTLALLCYCLVYMRH